MRLEIFSNELRFKAKFIDYIEDWREETYADPEEDYFSAYRDLLEDYQGGIKQRLSWNNPEYLKINKPFVQFYWLFDNNNSIVGTIRYRTNVPESLGNVGYEISPKHRNCGYGKTMLKELIEILKMQKVNQIILTVSKENLSSIKVIEANKGIYCGVTHRASNNEELNKYEIILGR